jgi:hypothetical protein
MRTPTALLRQVKRQNYHLAAARGGGCEIDRGQVAPAVAGVATPQVSALVLNCTGGVFLRLRRVQLRLELHLHLCELRLKLDRLILRLLYS